MSEIFLTGDTVVLKSGGPTMTVISVDQQTVHCVWFDHDQSVHGHQFLIATIRHSTTWGPSIPGAYREPPLGGGCSQVFSRD